jgi:hypothetical protein
VAVSVPLKEAVALSCTLRRAVISEKERRELIETVETEVAKRGSAGYDAREGEEQQHGDQAKRRREAISAALVA